MIGKGENPRGSFPQWLIAQEVKKNLKYIVFIKNIIRSIL